MSGDEYRVVTAIVHQVRPMSFLVERPNATALTFIPRSLIHAADDRKLFAFIPGDKGTEFTFRLRAWKAEELGLAGVDTGQGRML